MPLPKAKIKDAEHCEGGDEAIGELHDFLTGLMQGTETEEELTCVLHETSKGALGREIDTYVVDFDPENLDRKVKEIVDDAERNAIVLRGRIKFTLKVEGRTKSLTFSLDAPRPLDDDDDDNDDGDLDDLETPTKRGMIQQAQRFAEHSHREMRLAAKGTRELATDLRRANNDLREENRELREALRASLRLEQELHNMDHARRLDWMKQEKAEARKEQFVSGVQKILPYLGAAALGIDPKMMLAMMNPPQGSQQAPAQPGQPIPSGEVWTPIEDAAKRVIVRLTQFSSDRAGQFASFLEQDELVDVMALHEKVTEKLARERASAGQPQAQNSNGAPKAANGSAYGPAGAA